MWPSAETLRELGLWLLLGGILLLVLAYLIGFKVTARCRVLTDKGTPCKRTAKVVLGCKRDHKWEKPVAWLRRVGFRRPIDRVYLQLTKEPPVLVPFGGLPAEEAARIRRRNLPVETDPDLPTTPQERAQQQAQIANYRVARWSLNFGIIQAVTGIVSLIFSVVQKD
jgi:hypothetical protein